MSESTDGFARFRARLLPGAALRDARLARRTPYPEAGELWRVRWQGSALLALISEVDPPLVQAMPITLDAEPDDSALIAPASKHDLGIDLTIWADDGSTMPMCVLDFKLGTLASPGTEGLTAGTTNWGPTDPRSRIRANLQDEIEILTDAAWAPSPSEEVLDLQTILGSLDFDDVVEAVGSVPLASRLGRGEAELTEQQAHQLADLLGIPASRLLSAAQPPLPDELIAAMNTPDVRARVDQVAEARGRDEIETWRSCAYGVLALAAREHDRRQAFWESKVQAYFDAAEPDR